jgi:hypothetical protein
MNRKSQPSRDPAPHGHQNRGQSPVIKGGLMVLGKKRQQNSPEESFFPDDTAYIQIQGNDKASKPTKVIRYEGLNVSDVAVDANLSRYNSSLKFMSFAGGGSKSRYEYKFLQPVILDPKLVEPRPDRREPEAKARPSLEELDKLLREAMSSAFETTSSGPLHMVEPRSDEGARGGGVEMDVDRDGDQNASYDPVRLAELGEALYERLKDELEREYLGKCVLLNVEQGTYVVGEDTIDAAKKYDDEYGPETPGYFRGIGFSFHV